MNALLSAEAAEKDTTWKFRSVLCGSFRRDRLGLLAAYERLTDATQVLSPVGLDFLEPGVEFVRLPGEEDETVESIESRHLKQITEADMVWLHAPNGYVGTSASLELGHARALGIPVFSSEAPTDETLRSYVQVVRDPETAAKSLEALPGFGLGALQSYYRRTAERRGWASESAQDTLLLLTEELGELARAVRKSRGLARDHAYNHQDVASELADVQLYLVHLASVLGVDLGDAVTSKEKLNEQRFRTRRGRAA